MDEDTTDEANKTGELLLGDIKN